MTDPVVPQSDNNKPVVPAQAPSMPTDDVAKPTNPTPPITPSINPSPVVPPSINPPAGGPAPSVPHIDPPTIAATNLNISNVNCKDLSLNFTPGNGAGRIIIAHEGSAVSRLPVNGSTYQANSFFGSGNNLGNSNYVV